MKKSICPWDGTTALANAASLFQSQLCLTENSPSSTDTVQTLKPGYNLLSSKQLNIKNDNKMIMAGITNIIRENIPSETEDIILMTNTVIPYYNFVSR